LAKFFLVSPFYTGLVVSKVFTSGRNLQVYMALPIDYGVERYLIGGEPRYKDHYY
jgi:hypothetical protein